MAKIKQSVRDVMTATPVVLAADSPLSEAARAMRESDIGDVIVRKNGELCGIVTDRDIVIRAIATGMGPAATPLEEICSQDLTTVSADTPVDEAIQLMRDKAVRRLPVVVEGHPIGVVSISDLAIDGIRSLRSPTSARRRQTSSVHRILSNPAARFKVLAETRDGSPLREGKPPLKRG